MSVVHFKELQDDIDALYRQGKISDNEIFQSYVSTKKYEVPESFPDAKFVIVMGIFNPHALVMNYISAMCYYHNADSV